MVFGHAELARLTEKFERLPNGTMKCRRCGEKVVLMSRAPVIATHSAFGCPNGCDRDPRTIVQLLRSLYVPDELITKLKRSAARRRINLQEMLGEALSEYFKGALTTNRKSEEGQ
jgi:DNA-directed RNA polymerase subunit RPC12/RpoP